MLGNKISWHHESTTQLVGRKSDDWEKGYWLKLIGHKQSIGFGHVSHLNQKDRSKYFIERVYWELQVREWLLSKRSLRQILYSKTRSESPQSSNPQACSLSESRGLYTASVVSHEAMLTYGVSIIFSFLFSPPQNSQKIKEH